MFYFPFLVVAFAFAFALLPLWYDHAIVWLMRTCRIYAYPRAIRLAISLERDGSEWTFTRYSATHPRFGKLNLGSCSILSLEVDGLEWEPTKIERRIIWNAARAEMDRRISAKLDLGP